MASCEHFSKHLQVSGGSQQLKSLHRFAALRHHFLPMEISSLWIFGFLLIRSTAWTLGLENFPTKFVVANRNDPGPITLTCDAKPEGNVTWRFEGEEVEEGDTRGSTLILSEVDAPVLGEYSCWNGHRRLSSTYLLLEDEDEVKIDSLLSCRATSYDCNFHCRWNNVEFTTVRLGLGRNCTEGEKSCQWITESCPIVPDCGFNFTIPHSLSPYEEESTMLELTAEAIRNLSVLRRTKRFYLRDIVKPDSPQIVGYQEQEQHLKVTIEPPSSWSRPHSFFVLEHEIEYVLKDNGKTGRSSSSLIPKRISKLRVRSRDPFVVSAWSHWTSWKKVV
ncbi:interleukin-12 subunit beta [Gouania willdenowi]|uniref:interleukin-12 subunit beta n=1 Tax=Gouania willdenowi TaxID=441366 RepID=UPI0010560E0D|nr:interleukin-12 subunit beta-like [Gouania willdenowi]